MEKGNRFLIVFSSPKRKHLNVLLLAIEKIKVKNGIILFEPALKIFSKELGHFDFSVHYISTDV